MRNVRTSGVRVKERFSVKLPDCMVVLTYVVCHTVGDIGLSMSE